MTFGSLSWQFLHSARHRIHELVHKGHFDQFSGCHNDIDWFVFRLRSDDHLLLKTTERALANLGAVPTTCTVNGKALSSNITLGPPDVGALANTTSYGASLAADGRDISLVDLNGTTLTTVQRQDISGKLDKQAVYSSVGVTSMFFHEEDGGGYRQADTNDGSLSFIGVNADTDSPIKIETYAKTVADNIGTRIIQTLERIDYTAGNDSSDYEESDEVAMKSNIPTALFHLTNDGNYVVDMSYVHTDNNFPSAEKTKLAAIEDNHFKRKRQGKV
jgi:hypothetical protein